MKLMKELEMGEGRWTHSQFALSVCPSCYSGVEMRGKLLNLEASTVNYDDAVMLNRSCSECGTMWMEVYEHHASVVFPTEDAA